MVDKTLNDLLTGAPVVVPLTGAEPLETVVGSVSKGATIRQLSFLFERIDTTTSGQLLTEDQGRVVSMNNASANTFTIPLNATEAFPLHGTLLVRQIGVGATTIAAEGGVTINQRSSNTKQLAEKWAQCVLQKTGTDTWHIAGEFLAV